MLMFVVMAACDTNKSNQTLVPLAIGFAVFIAHMIGIPITGCSINPTRTFASSAAASGVSGCDAWNSHWVFWFAPILGASVAGILYEYCFHEGKRTYHFICGGLGRMPLLCAVPLLMSVAAASVLHRVRVYRWLQSGYVD